MAGADKPSELIAGGRRWFVVVTDYGDSAEVEIRNVDGAKKNLSEEAWGETEPRWPLFELLVKMAQELPTVKSCPECHLYPHHDQEVHFPTPPEYDPPYVFPGDDANASFSEETERPHGLEEWRDHDEAVWWTDIDDPIP